MTGHVLLLEDMLFHLVMEEVIMVDLAPGHLGVTTIEDHPGVNIHQGADILQGAGHLQDIALDAGLQDAGLGPHRQTGTLVLGSLETTYL